MLGAVISLAELLRDKDQIQNVDGTIAVGVWGRFTESVGNLKESDKKSQASAAKSAN